MEQSRYETSPSYGFIRKEFTRFNDGNLFPGKSYLFSSLKKIKLWYGTPAPGDPNLDKKSILAIECGYKVLEGKPKLAEKHGGKIESNDIIVKELELQDDDFFSKFYICFDDIITYIKLESHKGKILEIGQYEKEFDRTISFNTDKYTHVIQTFYGFYDEYALRAVGFRHVPKIYMLGFNLITILRFRHIIKNDTNKKDFWSDENNLNKLDTGMRAIARMIFLPDNPFSSVFKYCIG